MIHSAASLQQIMEEEDEFSESTTVTGESSGSLCSSNYNIADDACSSSPSSLESQMETKNGPLYGLSSLIAQLPMRWVIIYASFSILLICLQLVQRKKKKHNQL